MTAAATAGLEDPASPHGGPRESQLMLSDVVYMGGLIVVQVGSTLGNQKP